MAVEGGGAYRQSLIRNKRLRDGVARERANKYGIPSQALVAGARGGSRLAMTPGASGLGAERVRTSMTAGPGTMIEEMMPQNIIRGAADVRGNVRRTGVPVLDEFRPLLATISALAGNMADDWRDAATDPAAQAITRSPGFFAGRAGMKAESFAKEGSAEESARKARQDYKMFEDTWRAYSGGKSVDEFVQGAVVSPDGVVNFGGEAEQFMKAMEGTAAALGALNYVGWGAGKAVAKGLKAGLGPAITGTLGATTRAAGRLGRGGYAATTVGIRPSGIPVRMGRKAGQIPETQPQTRVITPEEQNIAEWGSSMGAPKGTGESRLNPEGRRGAPRFSRRQQGFGNAEFTTEELGYTPESYADEFNVSVDDARQVMALLDEYTTQSYRSNRGIGDDPIIASVEDLASFKTLKEVISKSPERYGNPTDDEIRIAVSNINKDIQSNPGMVFRMTDLEDGRLLAYTAIHHGDRPFYLFGPGNPADWRGLPNRLNMYYGARGK